MDRIIHKAAKVNDNGDVSGLCFKKPRPINLRLASWTLVDRLVTCRLCRKLMKAQQVSPDQQETKG